MVDKNSSFVDFVRFRPYTYARTQHFLSPLWAEITPIENCFWLSLKIYIFTLQYVLLLYIPLVILNRWKYFSLWRNFFLFCFCLLFKKLFFSEKIISKISVSVSEAVVQRCPVKKVFLKTSQYSQEKICVGVSRDSNRGVFLWILQNHEENLRMAAFGVFFKVSKSFRRNCFNQCYKRPGKTSRTCWSNIIQHVG